MFFFDILWLAFIVVYEQCSLNIDDVTKELLQNLPNAHSHISISDLKTFVKDENQKLHE